MFITYDQVKEYCCNTGNNDIIEIPSGQKWTPKKNDYNRINFKIKQKEYEPYRIKVESKTPNGWYVHKLSDTKYHCDNGNCYYSVMDNKLVGGKSVTVIITVKKGSNTATAQTEVTVETTGSVGGGGYNPCDNCNTICCNGQCCPVGTHCSSGHCCPKGEEWVNGVGCSSY